MLERRTTVLDNRKGKTKKVFTGCPDQVYVELLADCDVSYSVKMTPMPGFRQSDYLLEVTYENGEVVSFRNLYGETPDWANGTTDWTQVDSNHGAKLIASENGFGAKVS